MPHQWFNSIIVDFIISLAQQQIYITFLKRFGDDLNKSQNMGFVD